MKKFLLIALASFVSIFASAQINESAAEGMTKVVYAKSGAVQQGTTGTIDIVLKSDETVGCIACWFTLPDGVTVDESGSTSQGAITYNFHEGLHKFTIQNGSSWAASGSTPYVIASIKVNVPAGVELGKYPLNTQHWEVTTPAPITVEGGEEDNKNILANVTVQKTAVIEPQDPNYAFEIVPFTIKAGETKNIPLNLKSNGSDVCYFSCKVTYPSGITNAYTSGRGGAKVMNKATIVSDNLYTTVSPDDAAKWGVSAMTFSQTIATDGSNAIYTVNSETNSTFDTFVNTKDYKTIINIPVMADKDLTDGVYTLKISDISITTFDGANHSTEYVGGEYLASVIVGQPSAQEVILYGHYTDEAVRDFNKALKNVAVVDVSALAPYNEDFGLFEDVIMNFNTIEEESFSLSEYQRISPNYATTVLPYELTSTENVQFYTVKEMTASSIVIEEAATVDANTPCIFKGTLVAIGSPVTSFDVIQDIPLSSTTFKGTYEATSINDGAGYYISSNGNFYSDGASVRPFRAYFEGMVDNNASKLRVLLNTETGVEDITNELSDEAIYTLQGVRVNNAQKGFNIKGGKKVYVK